MKKSTLISLFLTLFFTASASSNIITTTFASNNGQSGNMFDVVNLIDDVTITAFDLNLESGNWDIEVYTKDDSWVGFDTDASAWTLVGMGSVTSAGDDMATFFDVADFLLDGFSSTALYITVSNGTAMNYTNGTAAGSVFADNGELQILEGLGKGYPFGSSFSPRVWNGSIYYDLTQVAGVPEPTPLALLALGLIGIALSARRQSRHRV